MGTVEWDSNDMPLLLSHIGIVNGEILLQMMGDQIILQLTEVEGKQKWFMEDGT
jgi:hypothetical protein